MADLRQTIISQNAANILVLDYEPSKATIPQLDLRHGAIGSKTTILQWWFRPSRSSKGKLWWSFIRLLPSIQEVLKARILDLREIADGISL
jgi:hypothetical protein